MKETTLVVFRKELDNNGIVALFPELPHDIRGEYCMCYAHLGQHSSAQYEYVVSKTVPATPSEYRPLAQELQRIGYHLKVVKRVSYRMHKLRRKAAKE